MNHPGLYPYGESTHEIIGIIISKELSLWNYWNPYEIIISAEYLNMKSTISGEHHFHFTMIYG